MTHLHFPNKKKLFYSRNAKFSIEALIILCVHVATRIVCWSSDSNILCYSFVTDHFTLRVDVTIDKPDMTLLTHPKMIFTQLLLSTTLLESMWSEAFSCCFNNNNNHTVEENKNISTSSTQVSLLTQYLFLQIVRHCCLFFHI